MKKIVILTGAGMSAESGLKTFRDADGLWEGHDIMEVATPEGFAANPSLVLEFYNQRRSQLLKVSPNKAHLNLVDLEKDYNIEIITQNVDDLHERAGSKKVLHLHGELIKARSTNNEEDVFEWKKDINLNDFCKNGHQIRPHIVWFGEAVPMLENAIEITQQADILAIIGTSMQVYPAASLVDYIKPNTPIYFIDPKPSVNKNQFNNLTIIEDVASSGTDTLIELLRTLDSARDEN
ncbi:NAD-dependent deacetylase [Lutibacter sp. Hel_I_33_5]|uniref:SIR2 family NAD-dependent protein deacylase n=1 Tax=Lutibacter sp. Hel_I_33_5 TaxID=1566289 RepID=UPI0011AA6211|nr:NAD-dependent deacylase [Lutibacter sp. Hel_I_33_5]TVZ54978.1 NAD-dependent deacetylase [Lutibacter sp. Hel_I_33_5]